MSLDVLSQYGYVDDNDYTLVLDEGEDWHLVAGGSVGSSSEIVESEKAKQFFLKKLFLFL